MHASFPAFVVLAAFLSGFGQPCGSLAIFGGESRQAVAPILVTYLATCLAASVALAWAAVPRRDRHKPT